MCNHKKALIVFISIVGIVLLSSEGQAATPKSLSQQVIEKLNSLPQGKTFTVRMGVVKEEYTLGDRFEIRFVASQNSYLTLIDIDVDGKITFLAPSRYVPADKKIESGRVYSTGTYPRPDPNSQEALYDLGMSLTVTLPRGTDSLYLCCSTQPIEWFKPDELGADGVYTILPDDKKRLKALLARLDKFKQAEWESGVEWAGASLAIEIGTGSTATMNVSSLGGKTRSAKWFPPLGETVKTGVESDKGDERF
jgi:hypothetical protein